MVKVTGNWAKRKRKKYNLMYEILKHIRTSLEWDNNCIFLDCDQPSSDSAIKNLDVRAKLKYKGYSHYFVLGPICFSFINIFFSGNLVPMELLT